MNTYSNTINALTDALLSMDKAKVNDIVNENYLSTNDLLIIESLLIQSLEVIGDGWNEGIYSLAQVYMCGVICEEIIDRLLPNSGISRITYPRLAIVALQDYHGLGKRIVSSVIRAAGYELLDFGLGLTPEETVAKSLEKEIDILLISTLMLHSALKVKKVKQLLDDANSNIKLVVGGAPFRFDLELWKTVGANACSISATDIVRTIEKVVNPDYE